MTASNSSTHPVTGKPWHVPQFKPHCWTDPLEPDNAPAELGPRTSWSFDCAACCADHLDAAWSEVARLHTPGCAGCARLTRAQLIRDGKLEPHPRTITNPQKRAA